MKPLLALLISSFFLLPSSFAAPQRPNVVLFLVDDMGWMDCGAYGSQYYETPRIDAFAKQAMRFTDAYAQPLCSPTRASLLTGKYTARHGITSASGHQPPQPAGHKFRPDTAPPNQPMLMPQSKNYMDPSEYTLAEALRDAGYRTAHIGKWHLGLTRPHWPEQQGFDVAWHCHPDPGPPGEYFSPYGVKPDGEPRGQNKVGNITDGPKGEYIVDRQAAEAVKFIQASKDRPFFLNLWCYGVHGPWGHKVEYTKYFAKKKDPRGFQGNPIMASMLKSVDDCFGRILDELDRQGLTDNTIIIFYSDNGGNVHSNVPDSAKTAKAEKSKSAFLADWRKWAGDRPPTDNTPLRDGKATLYEGGTRVPLMWKWPGHIEPGTTSDAVVGHIDLYPTVLDLIESTHHAPRDASSGPSLTRSVRTTMDGVSYAAVLLGTGKLQRKAFFNYFPHGRSPGRCGGVWVRCGDWKLFRWFGAPATYELYNLRDDLSETKDLAAAQPARVKELDALIDAFLADTGALYPIPNPAYKPRPDAPAGATPTGDPTTGLVAKSCKLKLVAGALRMEADGRAPFLGTAQLGKLTGPFTLKLRARSAAGGTGKVQWKLSTQDEFPATGQTVEFKLPAGADWQDVTVALPIQGQPSPLRLYLPADKSPVEIESIKYFSADATKPVRVWNFAVVKKDGT
ncbi:MAG: sulfatase [Verrucomicrobia bacterium]|nr:sulfatase [Verrucomicrobiota bacterium]